jgi:hypothetical protein
MRVFFSFVRHICLPMIIAKKKIGLKYKNAHYLFLQSMLVLCFHVPLRCRYKRTAIMRTFCNRLQPFPCLGTLIWLYVFWAQPRFGDAFVKLLKLYQATKHFPDYLVLANDDLYLDMWSFTNEYLISPILQSEQRPEDVLILAYLEQATIFCTHSNCFLTHLVNYTM